MWYKNIAGRFFGLVTKQVCDGQMDGWTDRQTELRRLPRRASIAALRGKKVTVEMWMFRESIPYRCSQSRQRRDIKQLLQIQHRLPLTDYNSIT